MKIGFVIPVLNNFQGAIELVQSIKSPYENKIYIQDQWRNQLPLSAAWNNGIDQALRDECEYIFVLNDDVILGPNSAENLIKEFEHIDGVVLASCNNIHDELPDPLSLLTTYQEYQEGLVSDHPNYSCFMVRKDFFDKVGRFDENFNPAWWEDNDSHYRIKLLGYRAICTTASNCVHFGGVTTKLIGNPESGKSENYYRNKWGSTRRNGDEEFKTPYNDPNLTPKDWRPNYA